MFLLVWSALWLWIISSHFRFAKLDQGETFIPGVTQYLVLKWFTTHLTSKECSECIHRSAFVNIYCSRRTLLPDSECTDAVFYQQTKAHVCALWRHAAWPEGQFRRMTKQAWVLHEAQNGDLAFVPWLKTLFSPLLHFSSSLVPSLFFLYRHFLPAFLHGIPASPPPPPSPSIPLWVGGRLNGHVWVQRGQMKEWLVHGERGWGGGQLFGLSQNEGYRTRYPRWFEGSTTGKNMP